MLRTLLTVMAAATLLTMAAVLPSRKPASSSIEAWAPFSAEFRTTDRKGDVLSTGRYWRAQDGSDRRDLERVGSGRAIQIRNVAERVCYRFTEERGWTAQPMVLPANGWKPAARPQRRDATWLVVEGMEALRITSPRGDYAVQVPSLNFFRLVRFTAASGRREEFFNVKRGNPPARLFEAPSGVAIARLKQPGGIIAKAAPAGSDDDSDQ